MKSRMMVSLLVIALMAAVIGGGTMAWFTAKAEVVNEFTAGTVMINADETGVYYAEDYEEYADMGNVNPGDCYDKEFKITNTGSKYALLRLSFAHAWVFDWDWLYNNWDALCFSTNDDVTKPGTPYDDTLEYDDQTADWQGFMDYVNGLTDPASANLEDAGWLEDGDYWYYDGKLASAAEETIEYIKVCFAGATMTNFFQSASYTLTTTVEAVQASNNASEDVWGITSVYNPETPQSGANWSDWGAPLK